MRLIGALAALTVGIVVAAMLRVDAGRAGEVVARVDGEPITVDEYTRQMSQERALVYDYFKKTYGVDDGPGFLDARHGGETPLDVLRRRSLDAVVRTKIQQLLMKEQSVLLDISYASFRASLGVENRMLEEASRKKQVIYGPRQYGEPEYFAYVFGNALRRLKEKLAERELAPTNGQLRAHYETMKKQADRKEFGYQSFDDVRALVARDFVDHAYDAYLAERLQHAKVEVVGPVCARVRPN